MQFFYAWLFSRPADEDALVNSAQIEVGSILWQIIENADQTIEFDEGLIAEASGIQAI